jgi:hypothetical protein
VPPVHPPVDTGSAGLALGDPAPEEAQDYEGGMTSSLIAVAVWLLASGPTALLVARAVRRADAAAEVTWRVPDFIPADVVASAGVQRLG